MRKYLEIAATASLASLLILWLVIGQGQDILAAAIQLGANYGPLTLSGEWWRLFAANFFNSSVLVGGVSLLSVVLFVPVVFRRCGLNGLFWLTFGCTVGVQVFVLLTVESQIGFGSLPLAAGLAAAGCMCLTFYKKDRKPLFVKSERQSLAIGSFVFLAAVVWLSLSVFPEERSKVFFALFIGASSIVFFSLRDKKLKVALNFSFVLVTFFGLVLVPKKYNYLPVYAQYQSDLKSCLGKSEGMLDVGEDTRDEKSVVNKIALLRAVLKTSCVAALEKSKQVAPLVAGFLPVAVWRRQVDQLSYHVLLLRSQVELLEWHRIRMAGRRLQNGKRWPQLVELLAPAVSKRPAIVEELLSKLKSAKIAKYEKHQKLSLERLIGAREFYKKQVIYLQKIRKLLANPAEPARYKGGKISAMMNRFEEKKKKCFSYADSIELTKKYYFVDFQSELETVLKESCRPALFLSERLQQKNISQQRKRYWGNLNLMTRKMIWKIHSTLEIIRIKEFEVEIGKLEYEGDWRQLQSIRRNKMPRRINKIQILLGEFKKKFPKLITTRDEYMANRLTESLKGYQGMVRRIGRMPASH